MHLAFVTPRKLPKPKELEGRVVVVDVAFASEAGGGGFEKVTLPFIEGLGPRLAAWVDHHDSAHHPRFAGDPRFVLSTKAEHGACPEMVTPELVERIGRVDTIACHNDFDGLVSAAKWMKGGHEPYPGSDDDARAVDTRTGKVGPIGLRFDRALRARPRDAALFGVIVRHLSTGLTDGSLWAQVDAAAAELGPIEDESRRLARGYRTIAPGVEYVEVHRDRDPSKRPAAYDKTLLLLLGQEKGEVAVVADGDTITVAAPFGSGRNFLELFGLSGGMPTRVSVPRSRLAGALEALGVQPGELRSLV